MADYNINEEAQAIREERREKHRQGDRDKALMRAEVRQVELAKIKQKLETLAVRAANLGEPDLAEDIRTCARFARKFAAKANAS